MELRDVRYFIISHGKSGSSTLVKSLKDSLRVHHNKHFQKQHLNLNLRDVIEYSYHQHNRKPLLISSFREPISRVISMFFESLSPISLHDPLILGKTRFPQNHSPQKGRAGKE